MESTNGFTSQKGEAPSTNHPVDKSQPFSQPHKQKHNTASQIKQEETEEPTYRDRISKQCAALQRHYRLSAREAEVMELLARGNSVAFIAEELVVSENTIRTHSRRIYAKLNIHKKQELLTLVDSFDPHDVEQ